MNSWGLSHGIQSRIPGRLSKYQPIIEGKNMSENKSQNRPFNLMSSGFALLFMLSLLLSLGFACSEESVTNMDANIGSYELVLEERSGTAPEVPNIVPHQQLDQNSTAEVLAELKTYLFSLDHVEEGSSRSSLPSALGAFIKSDVNINSQINREFTHIHIEPGPGSLHLTLRETGFLLVEETGWGIKHPWSDNLADEGLVLMMIYAPRNETDLDNIKKIISAAWHLALSEN